MDLLNRRIDYSHIVDLRDAANQHEFLEGQGHCVDHRNKVAYAAASKTHLTKRLFYRCVNQLVSRVLFDAADETALLLYHSNVLCALIGSQFVMIGHWTWCAKRSRKGFHSFI